MTLKVKFCIMIIQLDVSVLCRGGRSVQVLAHVHLLFKVSPCCLAHAQQVARAAGRHALQVMVSALQRSAHAVQVAHIPGSG